MAITGVTEVVSAAAADDKDDVTFVSGTRGIVAIAALAVAELVVARGITVKQIFFVDNFSLLCWRRRHARCPRSYYVLKVTVIYVNFICAVTRTYFLVQK